MKRIVVILLLLLLPLIYGCSKPCNYIRPGTIEWNRLTMLEKQREWQKMKKCQSQEGIIIEGNQK